MMDEKQFLRKILYNPFLREKFKDFDENRKYFNYYDKEEYVLKLQDLITKEIENMNQDTFDIELIVSWFKNILQDYYFEDIYLLVYGKFNELIRKKAIDLDVDIELYTTYISELRASDQYKLKEEKNLNRYLNLKNNAYIMNDEFERFVFALNSTKDNSEDNFGYVFNMILDKKYKISEIEYQDFFLRFSLFAMKEFGLENNCVSSSKKLSSIARHSLEVEENGKKRHHITFKTNEIKPSNIIGNLIALFHEIKHGVQIIEKTALYRIDTIKQLEDNLLRYYLGEEFYDSNYNYVSFETDAVICSQMILSYFLEAYCPLTYRREKDNLRYLIDDLLEDEKNNQRIIYNDSDDLQKIFSNLLLGHPEILNSDIISEDEKTVLLQIYNKDLTPKTPDCYFKEKEKLLLKLQSCSLNDDEKILSIKKKMDFYDAVLSSFEYNVENLKRNFIALDKYESNNPDIMAEVFQYKHAIIDKLIDYGYGINITTPQKRVIQ